MTGTSLTVLKELIEVAKEHSAELGVILNSPSAYIEDESKELVSSIIGILKIHDKTTTEGGKETFGIKKLIGSLESRNHEEYLLKIRIRTEDWVGYCVLMPDYSCLIGCAFVRRAKNLIKMTPKNWDGSKEMLAAFDKKIQK